ncbi:MAG TPA: CRISPR-associated endonuclease Cas2 [Ignavibacteriales bacterium]|nr:CRISPR-associated endonuclease Cas2 [Ignavibacteriales bacterium]HOL81688.1 CRISPR-associated endonuclease Cas2 [Ignavibacteriales bacterium]HOM65131.1 CRISPR-associated endonuclease Cas2 [Ignavibacteriales bacterium]HPD66855.1 CRISPR-associated endonuclease Cas2 [Ignavibacteriales bacterium]HPP33802.1 CRISPR-associated endonuclease Cas2 [Ignavibacteriales bacterium]
MRYLITYHITDDKKRNKVAKALEEVDFRLKYSVFKAELSNKKLNSLIKKFEKISTQKQILLFSASLPKLL